MRSSDLKKPEMILFDYGETLLWERDVDFLRGERAAFQYVDRNPNGVTPEQASAFGERFYGSLQPCRDKGFEIHEWQTLRAKYELLGVTFTLPLDGLETVIWDHASAGAVMPGVPEMLDYLRRAGIRTGVISNIGWSGQALTRRLDRLLPDNQFEFVLASSEYGIRKPNPLLFQIALKKAGLPASSVWFCGDNLQADVYGAHGAGIFPVWYKEFAAGSKEGPEFPCLAVMNWRELTDRLANLS